MVAWRYGISGWTREGAGLNRAYLINQCTKEGFIAITKFLRAHDWSKERNGILGNNKHDYVTCDSRIVQGRGREDDNNTFGNVASKNYGSTHQRAIGYILLL